MEEGKEHVHHPKSFDDKAKTWDLNPFIVEWTSKLTEYLETNQILKENYHCMEFGCGTGLLTINVSKHVASITGVDSSQGMIDQFNIKAEKCEKQNMIGKCLFLDRPGQLERPKFDFIYSNLTIHHIAQPFELFKLFYKYLEEGGVLFLADFEHQHNSVKFHPKDACGVEHHGFSLNNLSQWLRDANFVDVSEERAFHITKQIEGEEPTQFSCLAVKATKRSN